MATQDLSVYKESQLIDWYIRNRDWLAERKAEYEASIAEVQETQNAIEIELTRHLNDADAKSISTTSGSVTRSVRNSYTAEDKAAYGNFIIQSGAWEATTIKPTKEFVETYIQEHDGQLPPGVGRYAQTVLSVKRPTK